ncbi:hypothetical protein KQ304_05290 [Synechococcus sp. CS-1329]|uniref:calcium-binding protein n=1 Tax=Synechococcus sp. CS-1329 TaxID=2847975 RepID=UPI00223B188F|nr:hypothetical protein [Synechococcus sp. CS-1329]MCT0218421.1 hypothetical protein [Synechococcus sp. CS-1329]
MSESSLGSSVVFTDPLSVPAPPEGSSQSAVDATTTPVQLGGVDQAFTTQSAAPGEVAQVVVSGENNLLNVGTGAADVQVTGGGTIIESVQLFDTATGEPVPDASKVISLGNANVPYNGAVINTDVQVVGDTIGTSESISSAGGGLVPEGGFAYYASAGTGNDIVVGSSLNDFIRGGAGNDNINAGGGNDLVRGGAGNDTVFLGAGEDTLYLTIDQVGAGATDFLTDFTAGQDLVAVDSSILYSISGNQITFTGIDGSTSTLTAQDGVNFAFSGSTDGIIFIG